MPEYGKNIPLIEARKKAGLTLKKAAEGIGISYSNYVSYETGRRYPSKEMQEKICDFYHCKGISLDEDDVFPEEIRRLAKKEYIPKKEPQTRPEIVYLPPSQIRYLSDHNPVDIPTDYDIETEVIQRDLSETTREVLDSLTPREEKVLRMRFGIYEHTYEEIGRSFDVTRERIRQIEAKALSRLRNSSRAKKLKIFVESEE